MSTTNGLCTTQEPTAVFFDCRIEHLGGPTLRYTVKFSRTWWPLLGRVMLYSFLAEYHRQAGTTRSLDQANWPRTPRTTRRRMPRRWREPQEP